MLTKGIESAQKRVEGRNFDIRKHVLQFDNVINKQREIIYAQRKTVLEGKDIHDQVLKMLDGIVEDVVNTYTGFSEYPEEWDMKNLKEQCEHLFSHKFELTVKISEDIEREDLKQAVHDEAIRLIEGKKDEIGEDRFKDLERVVLLRVVDRRWMTHIDDMDQLKQGIGLRAYGQVNPVVAYTNEGFEMFEAMNRNIQEDTVKYLFNVEVKSEPVEDKRQVLDNIKTNKEQTEKKPVTKSKKPGRNDPCPCGSGKKYKKCCGQNE
ncbi:MAG TPA: hypothetical protein DHN33_09485 [Eubacteriaceae bacterium]|nr:hypothetical protein [Eubacteriaceae bacterium]